MERSNFLFFTVLQGPIKSHLVPSEAAVGDVSDHDYHVEHLLRIDI